MKLFFLLAYFGSCQIRFKNQRVSFATRVYKGTRDQDCKTSRFQWNSRKEHVLSFHMGWGSLLLIDDPTIYWLVIAVHKKKSFLEGHRLTCGCFSNFLWMKSILSSGDNWKLSVPAPFKSFVLCNKSILTISMNLELPIRSYRFMPTL